MLKFKLQRLSDMNSLELVITENIIASVGRQEMALLLGLRHLQPEVFDKGVRSPERFISLLQRADCEARLTKAALRVLNIFIIIA